MIKFMDHLIIILIIRTNQSYDDFKKITIDKTKSYMDSISVEKIYDILKKMLYLCA